MALVHHRLLGLGEREKRPDLIARRHTPYYHRFVEAGAELGDRIGFDAAVVFSSVQEEHLATREAVGIYDVYYQGPIDIKGPDAEALLNRVLVRDVARRLRDGGVLYSALCNEAGGIIDDLTCYRRSAEHFWLIATPSRVDTVESWLAEQGAGMRAYVTNTISGHAYLSLQGPRSRELLSGLTDADLSTGALPYFRFVETVVAAVPMLVSRTGYSGELGYELYYPRDYAEHVWDAVSAAGRAMGAKPAGLGALRSVRMEKKYPLYGLDINDTTSPLEANLAWAVDIDKGSFLGREALGRQRDEGVSRLLVGIEFADGSFVPSAGDEISRDGSMLGAVTSTEFGWFLGKQLAMGFVPPGNADREVVVTSGEGTSATGIVREQAFHDPQGLRVRV